jgi:hypothetical protein
MWVEIMIVPSRVPGRTATRLPMASTDTRQPSPAKPLQVPPDGLLVTGRAVDGDEVQEGRDQPVPVDGLERLHPLLLLILDPAAGSLDVIYDDRVRSPEGDPPHPYRMGRSDVPKSSRAGCPRRSESRAADAEDGWERHQSTRRRAPKWWTR